MKPHGMVLSRKKIKNSIRRHFSTWKYRKFEIDKSNLTLIVSNSDGKVSMKFDLLSTTIRIEDDYTPITDSSKDSFFLTLHQDNTEMILKFSCQEELVLWKNSIETVASNGISSRIQKSRSALILLGKFLRAKVK